MFKCGQRGAEEQGKSQPSLYAPLSPSPPPENIFGSGAGTQRLRTNRPLPSRRGSVTFSFPALEEANAEEKEAFLALAGQMGTGRSLSE